MKDFFSSDSRVPGGVKFLFLIGVLLLATSFFLSLTRLWCFDGLPWQAASAAVLSALLTYLLVTMCSMEMEKWGRFRSNSRVWSLFLMSIACVCGLSLASLSGVQTLLKWQKERGEKLQFLADMDIAIQNYGQVKVTFLELAETKLDQAYTKYGRNTEVIPGVKCVYGIESNESFSSSVRSKKKKALRDAINAKDGQLLTHISKKKQELLTEVNSWSINGLCQQNANLDSLVMNVAVLTQIYQEHFVNLECPSMLVQGSGDLEDDLLSLTRTRWDLDFDPIQLVRTSDILSLAVIVVILVMTLLPIFTARPAKQSKAEHDEIFL